MCLTSLLLDLSRFHLLKEKAAGGRLSLRNCKVCSRLPVVGLYTNPVETLFFIIFILCSVSFFFALRACFANFLFVVVMCNGGVFVVCVFLVPTTYYEFLTLLQTCFLFRCKLCLLLF